MDHEAKGRALISNWANALAPGGLLVVRNRFVHRAGWRSGPQFPALTVDQPRASLVCSWATPELECLEASVVPPHAAETLAPAEAPGYLLVFRRRAR